MNVPTVSIDHVPAPSDAPSDPAIFDQMFAAAMAHAEEARKMASSAHRSSDAELISLLKRVRERLRPAGKKVAEQAAIESSAENRKSTDDALRRALQRVRSKLKPIRAAAILRGSRSG